MKKRENKNIAIVVSVVLCLILALLESCALKEFSNSNERRSPTLNSGYLRTSNTAFYSFKGLSTTVDEDHDGISDDVESELIQYFAPIVRLHPDEKYQPSNINWYLTRVRMAFNVRLWFDNQILEWGKVNLSTLNSQFNSEQSSGLMENPTAFFLEQIDKNGGDNLDDYREKTREGPGPSDWVCYAHMRPVQKDLDPPMYDIQYIFFYGYNGDIGWGFIESGHEADFEHITVRIEGDLKTVKQIYFSAHGGEGKWYQKKSSGLTEGYTLAYDGRPIVYSAKYSHACYPWAEKWDRRRNFDDFTKDGGLEWNCKSSVVNLGEKLYPNQNMQWIQYSGHWGEIGEAGWTTSPVGPAYQDWWNEDPEQSSKSSGISLNTGGIIIFVAIGMIVLGGLVLALVRLSHWVSTLFFRR